MLLLFFLLYYFIFFFLELIKVPEVIYKILKEPIIEDEVKGEAEIIPQSLEEFLAEMKDSRSDAKTFALKLKSMVITPVYALWSSE